ncbi:hypothetical protein PMAYCL1PPCAC_27983, partial [Pristionchus mayeri]
LPQFLISRLESRVVLYLPASPFDVEEEAAVFSGEFHEISCLQMPLPELVRFPVENERGQVQS